MPANAWRSEYRGVGLGWVLLSQSPDKRCVPASAGKGAGAFKTRDAPGLSVAELLT